MNDTTDAPKLSWWRRLSSGLKRTSSSLGTAVADLVTKRKLDRAMLEDIEDVLLRADLGTDVAARIAEAVGAGRYDKAIILMIIGKCCTEAVKYAPALRRQKLQIDAVLVRKRCIAVRLQDLQLVHPFGKSAEEDCLAGAEDRRPPVQELVSLRFTLHCRRGRMSCVVGR